MWNGPTSPCLSAPDGRRGFRVVRFVRAYEPAFGQSRGVMPFSFA